jgi:AAA domain
MLDIPNQRGQQVASREIKPRLVPIAWNDLSSLQKRSALVSGLLDAAAMSVCYGASSSGKTFFALDLAAHVALGRPWRLRELAAGAVCYVAAEGGLGVAERLTAFRLHHGLEVRDVPLFVIAEPIDLCRSAADAALLIERCTALPPVRLIVIDTLSRVMAGGNENAPDDMGRFVANCDRLRIMTGAHVLVIHHTGKDEGRGARGHSLLRAAADTEIAVDKNASTGIATARVAKQRDHRDGDAFAFRLLPVQIGLADYNTDAITSCVVEPIEAVSVEHYSNTNRIPKAAQIALRALAEAVNEQGTVPPASNHIPTGVKVVPVSIWRQQAYRRGISTSSEDRAKQQAFKRASEHLIGSNRVGIWNEQVWLI